MSTTRAPANIDAVAPFPGFPVGTVVGDDTALTTSDGDTSYVEVYDSGFGGFGTGDGHTFTFEPSGPVAPDAVVTIEADWWTVDNGSWSLYFVHPDLGSRTVGSFVTGPDTDAHAYGDPQTITVSSGWVEDGAAFMAGVEWGVFALRTDLFVPTLSRITRLTMNVSGEVVIPLRQFHRDDGLGVAPPRAFGGASRIRTGRAYGYD